MQGRVNMFTNLPSGHSTQAYFSLMKQIYVPHTNVVKKWRTAIKTKNMGSLNFNTDAQLTTM